MGRLQLSWRSQVSSAGMLLYSQGWRKTLSALVDGWVWTQRESDAARPQGVPLLGEEQEKRPRDGTHGQKNYQQSDLCPVPPGAVF